MPLPARSPDTHITVTVANDAADFTASTTSVANTHPFVITSTDINVGVARRDPSSASLMRLEACGQVALRY